ncbi:hypothetical protein SCUCBS95973_006284 [Sporothrix curviconia]|uniref:Uncharacterized protein n=1 Tax=Sporothrix curviconia TaxID=1260050 RepID=A0ABP0C4B6_9PEZI
MFGLADDLFDRGLWSLDHELELRNRQFAAFGHFDRFCEAQKRMYQQPDGNGSHSNDNPLVAELRLWEVLQHRFRCGLDDFFRYGLRPSLGKQDARGRGGTFAQYCTKLTAVLVHPLWGSSHLAHVRWLLMRIIQERVPGHIEPLVPPYSYDRPPFVNTARHWGFEESMRMSLAGNGTLMRDDEETESLAGSNSMLGGLATASHEASRAAVETEAEMAQFLFRSSAPRDFWWLDRQLMPLYEPGKEALDEASGDSDDQGSGGAGSPMPLGYEVHDTFRHGAFKLADSYEGCEAEERQELLRREDNMTNRKGDWEQHEKRVREGKTGVSENNLREDQVFFELRIQDVERLLVMISRDEFRFMGDFKTPDCYLLGYIHAHALFGYGQKKESEVDSAGGGQTAPALPVLTCMQCAQKYHQGRKDHDLSDDNDDDDDDDDGIHDHHGHFIHQQFIQDIDPSRGLEWLVNRKCEWLLAGCRERMIREALGNEDEHATETNHKQLSLPDIPPFDPPTLAQFDRMFTHPSQLAVLDQALSVPHVSELWCFDGLQEQERGDNDGDE